MFVRICKFFVVDQPTSRYDICVAWFGLRTPAQIVARVFAFCTGVRYTVASVVDRTNTEFVENCVSIGSAMRKCVRHPCVARNCLADC